MYLLLLLLTIFYPENVAVLTFNGFELVLDDGGAGVDEPSVGDHTELLHLAAQEHAGGSQQQRVHGIEAVHRVEPLEEHRGAGNHLI